MPYSTCMSSRRGTGTFNPFFQNKILQIMDVPLFLCSRRVSPDSSDFISAEILATSLSGVSPLLSVISPMVSCHARDEVFKHFVQKDFRILTMMIARLKLMCESYKSVYFEMREAYQGVGWNHLSPDAVYVQYVPHLWERESWAIGSFWIFYPYYKVLLGYN